MHATEEEAREETMRMLNIYADFWGTCWPCPWSGPQDGQGGSARRRPTLWVHDARPEGHSGGTSHYFGTASARAFDITFTGKDNQLHHPHQTSWGVSTRMIGGIIMTPRRQQRPGAAPASPPSRPWSSRGPAQARRSGRRQRPAGPPEGRRHPGRHG